MGVACVKSDQAKASAPHRHPGAQLAASRHRPSVTQDAAPLPLRATTNDLMRTGERRIRPAFQKSAGAGSPALGHESGSVARGNRECWTDRDVRPASGRGSRSWRDVPPCKPVVRRWRALRSRRRRGDRVPVGVRPSKGSVGGNARGRVRLGGSASQSGRRRSAGDSCLHRRAWRLAGSRLAMPLSLPPAHGQGCRRRARSLQRGRAAYCGSGRQRLTRCRRHGSATSVQPPWEV